MNAGKLATAVVLIGAIGGAGWFIHKKMTPVEIPTGDEEPPVAKKYVPPATGAKDPNSGPLPSEIAAKKALEEALVPEFTLEGHTQGLLALKFSPDGKMLASASGDKTVMLWDVASRRAIRTLEGHRDIVFDVNFSPDGKQVISGGWDQAAIVWDVATGAIVSECACPQRVLECAFLPDGKHFVTAAHRYVEFWETGSKRPIARGDADDEVHGLAVLADGRVVTGDNAGAVIVWDPNTGRQIAHKRHDLVLGLTAVGPESVWISLNGSLWQWDVDTESPRVLNPRAQGIADFVLPPDHSIAATGRTGAVFLMDPLNNYSFIIPAATRMAGATFDQQGHYFAIGSSGVNGGPVWRSDGPGKIFVYDAGKLSRAMKLFASAEVELYETGRKRGKTPNAPLQPGARNVGTWE